MKVTQEQFKTTKDQLVVLIPDIRSTTEKGIVLPETVIAERLKDRGLNEFLEVVGVGPEAPVEINVGDFVLVSRVIDVPVEADKPDFKVGVCRAYDIVGYYAGDK